MLGCFKTQFPATLPSAAFWYSTEETSLGNMASWTGRIAANNATQGTTANQPVNTANIIGGKPSLLFDGVDDVLTAPSNSLNSNIFATGGTIAGVFRFNSLPVGLFPRIIDKNQTILTVAGSGAFVRLAITFSGLTGNFDSSNNSIQVGTNYFVVITYNSSSTSNVPTIYLNSTSGVPMVASTIPTGTATSDSGSSLSIGNKVTTDRPFNGYISEIMGFRTILDATQISQLITYLRNNWGL